MPFYPFWGEGSPTKIERKKFGTLILTSLLEDLVELKVLVGGRVMNFDFRFCLIVSSCPFLPQILDLSGRRRQSFGE